MSVIKCFSFLWGWSLWKGSSRSILLSWSTSTGSACGYVCLKWWFPSWSWFHYYLQLYAEECACNCCLSPEQSRAGLNWPCSLLVCSLSLAMGVSPWVGSVLPNKRLALLFNMESQPGRGGSFQSAASVLWLGERKSMPVLFRAIQFLQPFS